MGKDISIVEFYEKPKMEQCLICYIDILGTKNNTDTMSYDEEFEHIYTAFENALCIVGKMKTFGELQFKIFSDNILIVHKVKEPYNIKSVYKSYRTLSFFLKSFLLNLVRYGILCRGGITFDDIAFNEVMVWGKGLIDVVKIEENIAIYPRIIISPKLLKVFNDFGYNEYEFDDKFSCLTDVDGSIYFDYVDYSTPPDAEKLIKESSSIIIKKREHEKDPRILQKYNWHIEYLKRAKEIYIEIFGKFPL